MIRHLFIIVKPIHHDGETYLRGDETRLRSRGFVESGFRMALYDEAIEPATEGMKWYKGPHYTYFWDAGIYTEQEVYESVILENKRVWQVGSKRVDDVKEYFGIEVEKSEPESELETDAGTSE